MGSGFRGSALGLVLGVVLAALPMTAAAQEQENEHIAGLGEKIYQEGKVQVFGDGPDVLALGVGAFDAVKKDPLSAEFRAEYRWGQKLLFVGPLVGVMANTDGGVFGYGGGYFDIQIGRVVLTPTAGMGGYRRGDSKHLGGTFNFHIGFDMAYRFDDGARLGVKFSHISNAFTQDINPGAESFLLTYSMPLGNMFEGRGIGF